MKRVIPRTYSNKIYPFKRPQDLDRKTPASHRVVIVGAGPTGLMAALDLAGRGISSVILMKEKSVVVGSRAICFSKKTLEVVNRVQLRAVRRMLEKGVTWSVGKVFYRDEQVYEFDLLPEAGHKIPAFINLQQYYFEEYLVEEIEQEPRIDLRWQQEMIDLTPDEDKVTLTVKTPEGHYQLEAEYLLACDGVNSPTRKKLGIPFEGERFAENFLIADITMENDFPTERWFWFDPPFNKGYSALLHKQPDNVWRIDLQLGRDIDKELELDQDRIRDRLRQMLGADCNFELEWTSIYQFRCMHIEQCVHGRVIFAGDAAHLVSPFGARGANGGVQDTDNLIWKLAYVLEGKAAKELLHSYQEERSLAALENIYHSTNATDFISPKSAVSTVFRNAVLELAKNNPFARGLVNSGRLSDPYRYIQSPLTTPDQGEDWDSRLQPGWAISDLLLERNGKTTYLIDELSNDFSLVIFDPPSQDQLPAFSFPVKVIPISTRASADSFFDVKQLLQRKYDARPNSWYLIRPDHYLAARGRILHPELIQRAYSRAIGRKVPAPGNAPLIDQFKRYEKDEMYRLLIQAHEGLSKAESDQLNAKMILMMMERINNKSVLEEVLRTITGDPNA